MRLPSLPIPGQQLVEGAAGAVGDFVKQQALQAWAENHHARPGDPGWEQYYRTHYYSIPGQMYRANQKNADDPWRHPFSHALLELPAEGLASLVKKLTGSGSPPVLPPSRNVKRNGVPQPYVAGTISLEAVPKGDTVSPLGKRPASQAWDGSPVVRNKDGTTSSVLSSSFSPEKGKEILIPLVWGGKILTPKQAEAMYRKTGKNFGTFRTPEEANAYGEWLHQREAKRGR